jgi:hypothetical protein
MRAPKISKTTPCKVAAAGMDMLRSKLTRRANQGHGFTIPDAAKPIATAFGHFKLRQRDQGASLSPHHLARLVVEPVGTLPVLPERSVIGRLRYPFTDPW